eukprot:gene18421-biopygen14483
MRRRRRRYRGNGELNKNTPSGGRTKSSHHHSAPVERVHGGGGYDGARTLRPPTEGVISKHPVQMKRLLCIQKECAGPPGRRDPGGSSCVPKEPLGRRRAGRAQGGGGSVSPLPEREQPRGTKTGPRQVFLG